MENVLLITYYFPPSGGIGGVRVSKMAKFFPQFNWKPLILTVSSEDNHLQDKSLLNDIPSPVEIFTTPRKNPLQFLSSKKLVEPGNVRFSDYLLLPDNKIWWLPSLYKKGKEILSEHDVSLIIVSVPPYSPSFIGATLSQKFDIPLVLDYRDSWNNNPLRPNLPFLHARINKFLEKRVLDRTNYAIGVNEFIIEDIRSLSYSEHSKVISNGFDPDDFKAVNDDTSGREEKNLPLKIKYIGSVYSNLNYPDVFLETLSDLNMDNNQVEIEFIGKTPPKLSEDIDKHALEGIVDIKPFVPHSEALKNMKKADLLLLYLDLNRKNLRLGTGKLMEYIGSSTPILAIVPQMGISARIIRENNLGVVLSPNNKDKIKSTIRKLVKSKEKGELEDSTPPEKYNFKVLMRKYCHVLDSLTS